MALILIRCGARDSLPREDTKWLMCPPPSNSRSSDQVLRREVGFVVRTFDPSRSLACPGTVVSVSRRCCILFSVCVHRSLFIWKGNRSSGRVHSFVFLLCPPTFLLLVNGKQPTKYLHYSLLLQNALFNWLTLLHFIRFMRSYLFRRQRRIMCKCADLYSIDNRRQEFQSKNLLLINDRSIKQWATKRVSCLIISWPKGRSMKTFVRMAGSAISKSNIRTVSYEMISLDAELINIDLAMLFSLAYLSSSNRWVYILPMISIAFKLY